MWQTTYEDLKGAKWLLGHARDPHPSRVRFRTIRPRDGDDAWAHVTELGAPDGWGQLDARVQGKHAIAATTSGIEELRFDRDPKLVDEHAPLAITLDGTALSFDASAPLVAHRDGAAWKPGPAAHAGPWKRGDDHGPVPGRVPRAPCSSSGAPRRTPRRGPTRRSRGASPPFATASR